MSLKLVTFKISQSLIAEESVRLVHPLNIAFMLVTCFVSHLESESKFMTEVSQNIFSILVTLLVSQSAIGDKSDSLKQLKNVDFILVTLLTFHFAKGVMFTRVLQ